MESNSLSIYIEGDDSCCCNKGSGLSPLKQELTKVILLDAARRDPIHRHNPRKTVILPSLHKRLMSLILASPDHDSENSPT